MDDTTAAERRALSQELDVHVTEAHEDEGEGVLSLSVAEARQIRAWAIDELEAWGTRDELGFAVTWYDAATVTVRFVRYPPGYYERPVELNTIDVARAMFAGEAA